MLNILYLFKNKEKLTQQEINQDEEAKIRAEARARAEAKVRAEEEAEAKATERLTEAEAKAKEEEKRLYEEEHKALVEKYNEIYPTAIIIIKDFQIFSTRFSAMFSFIETVQEDDVRIYRKNNSNTSTTTPDYTYYITDWVNPYRNIEKENNYWINKRLCGFKLIKNDFNEVQYQEFERKYYKFQKSKTANSYYNITNGNLIYLNEQDWNVLIGKK